MVQNEYAEMVIPTTRPSGGTSAKKYLIAMVVGARIEGVGKSVVPLVLMFIISFHSAGEALQPAQTSLQSAKIVMIVGILVIQSDKP